MKGTHMAPASTPSWVGKLPADMTDEELKDAKQTLAEQIAPAQERLNTLSAAIGQLDREVNERFRMSSGLPPANTLPAYPLDAITTEYGATPDTPTR